MRIFYILQKHVSRLYSEFFNNGQDMGENVKCLKSYDCSLRWLQLLQLTDSHKLCETSILPLVHRISEDAETNKKYQILKVDRRGEFLYNIAETINLQKYYIFVKNNCNVLMSRYYFNIHVVYNLNN